MSQGAQVGAATTDEIRVLSRLRDWDWLCLGVDVQAGRLFWRWQDRLRSDSVQETVVAWKEAGIGALVWDNAPAHHAKIVTGVGLPLAYLPAFSPELNPAERVFEEVRRWVEGKIYASLSDKRAAVDSYLTGLSADVESVKRLTCWDWIKQSMAHLKQQQKQTH